MFRGLGFKGLGFRGLGFRVHASCSVVLIWRFRVAIRLGGQGDLVNRSVTPVGHIITPTIPIFEETPKPQKYVK